MLEPGWENKYIGVPWANRGREMDAFDCYGQLRLVLLNEAGIELPSYSYVNSRAVLQVNHLIEGSRPDWSEVLNPQPLDVVLMGSCEMPYHVGVYIGGGRFLNTMRGQLSHVERVSNPTIRNRIHGYYRHHKLMGSFGV